MAITLMTTTGTEAGVREALGLTPAANDAPETGPGPYTATTETLPTPKPVGEATPAIEAPAEAPPAVEPVTAAPAEEPVPDSEFDDDGEPLTERAARSSRSKMKTIHKLRARARDAETRAARLEGELAVLRGDRPASETAPSTTNPQPPVPVVDPDEPTEAKFETYEAFIEARADYRARKAVREELDQRQRQDAEIRQRDAFAERIKAFAADHPDYDEVLRQADVPLPPAIIDFLRTRAEGPALAYTLAKDPARLRQLVALPPDEAFEALVLARADLRRQAESPKAETAPSAPPIPTTTVPPPPRQVRGSTITSAQSLEDLSKAVKPGDAASYSAWLQRRNEQLRASGLR